jgi:aldose 1-epimerase
MTILKTAIAAGALLISAHAYSATSTVKVEPFGAMPDGQSVELYTLKNKRGMTVTITNYGATIVGIKVPDRHGKFADVVLGFDRFADYVQPGVPYFGSLVGRYGNRIANATFTLDGKAYTLTANDGVNHLHGGTRGFDKLVWKAEIVKQQPASVRLSLRSLDGDQCMPGNLDASVTYTLDEQNSLHFYYEAKTDKPTVINLTNHTYFNLNGGSKDVLDQRLHIVGDRYLPVNDQLIPTGELRAVANTPMDFKKPALIGKQIAAVGGKPVGYDHNYVLKKKSSNTYSLAAVAEDPASGRVLRIYTDQPGLQFYSGNFLDGSLKGKNGQTYAQYFGYCLEPQHFPDSPNQAAFPSTVLRPGEVYKPSRSFVLASNKVVV